MGHLAKVIDGLVVEVIVGDETNLALGIHGDPSDWVQTSYNTRGGVHYGQDGQPDGGVALRKNYAGIGYTYDSARDAFIPPKPHASWILDEDTCWWKPPVDMPTDLDENGQPKRYYWDEESVSWLAVPAV
jgi:hypothetical protein